MKTAKLLLAAIFLVILSGCQTKSNDSFPWQKLQPGMTKSEVISTLGEPDSVKTNDDGTQEILLYKRTQSTFSALLPMTYRYEIFMRNNKLIRFSNEVGL